MKKLNNIGDMTNKPVTTFTWSIILPVLVVPLFIVFLYVLGRGWDMGYLTEFGVQDDLVYGGVDRTLFFGVFSIVPIFKIFFTVCGLSVAFLLLIFFVFTVRNKKIVIIFLNILKKYDKQLFSINEKEINVLHRFVFMALYSLGVILFCLFLFIVMQLAHSSGKHMAVTMKENFHKTFVAWHNYQKIDDKFFQRLIPVEHNDWPMEVGYVIASNPSYTVFFTENGTKTYPSNSIRLEQIDGG